MMPCPESHASRPWSHRSSGGRPAPAACADASVTQALPTLTAAMCGGLWPPAFGLAVRFSKITWLAWHFQAHRTSKSGRRPPRQITARERPDRRHWRIVPCAACARIADQNGVQFGQPVRWLRRRPPRRLRPPPRCCRSCSRSCRRPGRRTAVPSRRARTGWARRSASATEPPGRPGFGRRGSRTPAAGGRRQPRWPNPLARSSSHRAGAVSAIHSGLLTTSSQNLGRRPKT
jgi:hypothetical protein